MAMHWFQANRIYKTRSKRNKRRIDYLLGRYGPVKNPKDLVQPIWFLADPSFDLSLKERLRFISKCFETSFELRSYHTQDEVLTFAAEVLRLAPRASGDLVECGCFKGGATVKFSYLAELIDRKLHVFDSFQGLPHNEEPHDRSIFGSPIVFPGGRFRGDVNEVKSNIARFGVLKRCQFYPGWFEDTLPSFNSIVLAAFIDVDLRESTRQCIAKLYPLLAPGGVIFSQDGHVPLVVDLLKSESFWSELGTTPPTLLK
jgi:O-methyltransferase